MRNNNIDARIDDHLRELLGSAPDGFLSPAMQVALDCVAAYGCPACRGVLLDELGRS